jgi:hypothetical protein
MIKKIIIDMILRIYRDKQWFVADFPGAIFSSMLGMILIDLGSFSGMTL